MTTERITRYVRLVVDGTAARRGSKEIRNELRDINRQTRKTQAVMQGFRNTLLATFGAVGIAQGVRAIVGGAARAEQQFARLEAVIVSTGGSAGRSLSDIEALARDIGINTLASTQGVRDAAGILLTFRGVAGDTFDRTLRLSQDLAEAGIGNLETNVLQLGKALNDPVRGVTALARSGVTFSDAQREVIKTLVESGDLLGAQTLILDELNAQVGGAGVAAAKGFNGALDTLIERAKLFGEAFGGQSLNLLNGFIRGLAAGLGFITDNISTFNGALIGIATIAIPKVIFGLRALAVAALTNPFTAIIAAAATLGGLIGNLVDRTVTYGNSTATVGEVVGTVWRDIKTVVGDFFSDFFNSVGTFLSDFDLIGEKGTDVWTLLINGGKQFLNFNIGVFKSLVDFSIAAFRTIFEAGRALWEGLSSQAAGFAKAAKAALTLDFEGAQAALDNRKGFDFSGVTAEINNAATTIGNNFGTDFIGAATPIIEGYVGSVIERAAANRTETPSAPGITPLIAPETEDPTSSGGGGGGRSPISALDDDKTAETWAERTNKALDSVGSTFDKLSGVIGDSLGKQSAAFKAAFAINKATALATAIINTSQAVTEALKLPPPAGNIQAGLAAAAGAAEIATITATAVQGFEKGGFTGNVGRREVAGVVHGQEFVMNAEATRRNRPALEAMNAGGSPMMGDIKVVVVDDRESAEAIMSSSRGERIVMAHVGKNT